MSLSLSDAFSRFFFMLSSSILCFCYFFLRFFSYAYDDVFAACYDFTITAYVFDIVDIRC